MPGSKLLARIQEIAEKSHLRNVAVALYDLETSLRFSYQGDCWFHAASTFKAGILFALFKAAEEGSVRLDDHLHVRNRFISIIDGSPYRIEKESDGDLSVHKAVGRSMSLRQLARVMITRSSNLATNLLFDFLGTDTIRSSLSAAHVSGLEIRRGVEDTIAFQQGISNEATADGLLSLFRAFLDTERLGEEFRKEAMDILLAQEFNSMIPARLPDGVRVAHKTGEISSHCHDAGIVFTPDRQPYVVAILTETGPEADRRQRAVAEISGAIYRYLTGAHKEERVA